MVSSTRLPAVFVAGVATLATMASAQIDSVAQCRFNGRGVAGSVSEIVGINIAANVTAFLCNSPDVTDINATANITAMEIATATATAIANTTADCFAQGNARFTLNGMSLAIAEAVAIAESVAEASLDGSVCGKCEVAAQLFARSYTAVFLAATGASEATLAGTSTGNENVTARANGFVAEYVNATAVAYAEILASVRAGVDGECNGTLLVDVGNELDGVECAVSVSALGSEVVRNAASEAVAQAVVLACNNSDGEVSANITTEAIATAVAIAMAEISTTCIITGDARACTITEAEANATAQAVATAFAFLYVNATNECEPGPCEVSAAVLTEALEFVLVSATTSALLEQCGGPDDIFNITLLQTQIVEQSATALSALIFNVTVAGGECIADLDILAGVIRGDIIVNNTRVIVDDTGMGDMDGVDNMMDMTDGDPMMNMTDGDDGVMDMIDGDIGMMNMTDDTPDGPPDDTPGDPDAVDPAEEAEEQEEPEEAGMVADAEEPTPPPPCGSPCAGNNMPCGGLRFDAPVPCCSPSNVCVRLSPFLSQCRSMANTGGRELDECSP
eukprot:jgi/Ulvmu1/4723/UM020_0006.1